MSDEANTVTAESAFFDRMDAIELSNVAKTSSEPPKPTKPAEPPVTADSDEDEGDDSPETDDATDRDDDDADDDSDASDDDAADDDEEDEAAFEAAFTEALSQQGVSAKKLLAGLPDAARVVVEKRISELQSGFTKATQEAKAGVARLQELEADVKHFDENFVDIAFLKFCENPELMYQVNAMLPQGEMSDEEFTAMLQKAAKYGKRDLQDKREAVLKREGEARSKAEASAKRMQKIETDAIATAKALGMSGITTGMRLELQQAYAANENTLERSEVQAIVKKHHRELKTMSRSVARDASATAAKEQAKRHKDSKLPMNPKSGVAAGMSANAKPKSDKEFVDRWADG